MLDNEHIAKASGLASGAKEKGNQNEKNETTSNDVLQKLSETKMQSGRHHVIFVDTSVAWDVLKDLHKAYSVEDLDAGQKKAPSYAFQSFQDILEADVGTRHDNEAILPEHAQYDYLHYDPKQTKCTFCHETTDNRSVRHTCRVCGHVFHAVCIKNRGFCNDTLSCEALEESTSNVGWSCPSCESLFSLLETKEQEEIMGIFNEVAGSDEVIDRIEFLLLRKEEYLRLVGIPMPIFREQQEEELFAKIDRNHTGTIDYWEFLPYMAVRFLSRRSSMELLRLITPREIANFKEFFEEMDTENIGRVPQPLAKQAYINWYKSKVKQSPSNYIDYEWYGGLKENPLLQSLKKSLCLDDSMSEGDDTLTSVEWTYYLKQCSLHILAARENTVSQKPLIPGMPFILFANDEENKKRGDDDFLRMCQEAMEFTSVLEKKGFK